MRHPADHIFEFTPDTLGAWCEARRMPRFRAGQVLEWVYEKGVVDPEKMSNLSKVDRAVLAKEMTFLSGEVLRHEVATDGTQKLLVEWGEEEQAGSEAGKQGEESDTGTRRHSGTGEADGGRREGVAASLRVLGAGTGTGGTPVPPGQRRGEGEERDGGGDPSRQTECVMIPSLPGEDEEEGPRRYTACVSSQVGCPVGCRFCASGLTGLDANLSAGRIVEQVWRLGRLEGVRRITNVVFMGMGEPLANLGAVVPAVRTITSLWGLGISARKVTISTVGLPRAIEKLAEQLDLPVTLALSLHAPNDELRRRLIPWAEYTTVAELLGACRTWFERTGREVTLEYTLLRGVNDRPEHAGELAGIARTLRGNVNLIRYNEVAGLEFKRPRDEDVREFQRLLRAGGVKAHIRASRGRDIAAACGQLRHENRAKAAGAR